MKKTILFVIVFALLLAARPAAAGSDPAYFASPSKPGILPPRASTLLTPYPFFNVSRPGAVTWYDYARGALEAVGTIHMTGTFRTETPPGMLEVFVFIYRKSDSALLETHKIVSTSLTVAPFSYLLFMESGEYFQLYAYQASSQPTALTTSVVFEAIP